MRSPLLPIVALSPIISPVSAGCNSWWKSFGREWGTPSQLIYNASPLVGCATMVAHDKTFLHGEKRRICTHAMDGIRWEYTLEYVGGDGSRQIDIKECYGGMEKEAKCEYGGEKKWSGVFLSPRAPETSSARAFRLVANQTSSGPLHGRVLTTLTLGNSAITHLAPPDSGIDGRLFYLNGTAEDWDLKRTHVVTDWGAPVGPWGMNVTDVPVPTGEFTMSLVEGSGQYMLLARSPAPVPRLENPKPGVWIACERYVRPVNAVLSVVAYVPGRMAVPGNCAVVELLPECAELKEPPAGSESDHAHALTVKCYEDVSAVDWSS